MDPITITVRNNGSLFITGDQMAQVRLVDHEGNEISTEGRKALSLCRCGASTKKPFCDGTHSKIGFQGAIAAQQAFDAGRDLVRKIYDRARIFRTEECHAADDGSAGPHVAAAYGTREDQNVSVALLHSHGSIILILLEKAIDSSSRTITMSEGASS